MVVVFVTNISTSGAFAIQLCIRILGRTYRCGFPGSLQKLLLPVMLRKHTQKVWWGQGREKRWTRMPDPGTSLVQGALVSQPFSYAALMLSAPSSEACYGSPCPLHWVITPSLSFDGSTIHSPTHLALDLLLLNAICLLRPPNPHSPIEIVISIPSFSK